MKIILKINFVLILLTELIIAQNFGSTGSVDARSIALGASNTIFSRGVNAIGVNPANLAIEGDKSIEISTVFPLPSISVFAGNDFITLNDYNYFFTGVKGNNGEITGKYLDETEKKNLLNLFNDGSKINSNAGINLFSAYVYPSKSLGAFGFSINDWVGAQFDVPQEIFELILYGNIPNKVYDLKNIDGKAWYIRNYAFSYSRDFSDVFKKAFRFFSAGFSVKMVQGFAYAGFDRINTTLKTENDYNITVNGDSRLFVATSPSFGVKYDFEGDSVDYKGDAGLFNKPAGTGLGFDFGVYAELNKAWSIAFALTDLGSINWDKRIAEYSSNGVFVLEDITDDTLVDSLTETITGKGKEGNAFSTDLATAIKIGAGLKVHEFVDGYFPGKLFVEVNYHQGFNNMPSNSKRARFSLGAEWLPWEWFAVRTGLSFGGFDKFRWGAGLGFDTGLLVLDFSTAYAHSIFNGNNAKRLGFAMSTKWVF